MMRKFQLIISLLLLPFLGKTVDALNPIETIAVITSGTIKITHDQKYFAEPIKDHLPFLNNTETGYQAPPENIVNYFSIGNKSAALFLNITSCLFIKQQTISNSGSSRKRFIKLRVLLI